jgi:hypothetical protein
LIERPPGERQGTQRLLRQNAASTQIDSQLASGKIGTVTDGILKTALTVTIECNNQLSALLISR